MEKASKDMAEETPKMVKVPVPTQKTFVIKGSASAEEIDKKINPWLKSQALNGQIPFLGKVTSHKTFFSSKLVYVFMYNSFVEVAKKV